MRIYVDFDDVLCETAKALSLLAKELFGRDVPYGRIRFFNLQQSFSLNDSEIKVLMQTAHCPDFLANLAETPDAKESVKLLLEAGNKVTVVTGRPVTSAPSTRTWLERHGYPLLPILYVDKYSRARPDQICNGQRAITRKDFEKILFDAAIDDSPTALDLLAHRPECRTLVFSRPWNVSYTLTASMRRVAGWTEAVRMLLQR